jgi:hypothetical protein
MGEDFAVVTILKGWMHVGHSGARAALYGRTSVPMYMIYHM